MSRTRRFFAWLLDPTIGLALAVAYVALLLATNKDLGYARDEGFYFQAARSYEGWFSLLFDSPKAAFERANIDRFWVANSEHPAFVKSLFALSHHFLYAKWKLFAEEGTSFRFPGMALSGVAVAVTYLWGRRVSGRVAGLVGGRGIARQLLQLGRGRHLLLVGRILAGDDLLQRFALGTVLLGKLGALDLAVDHGSLCHVFKPLGFGIGD